MDKQKLLKLIDAYAQAVCNVEREEAYNLNAPTAGMAERAIERRARAQKLADHIYYQIKEMLQ